MEALVLSFTSLQNIVTLSITVIVPAGVKAQMLYVHITGHTIFVIFSKTGFVYIVPLCCTSSICIGIVGFTIPLDTL